MCSALLNQPRVFTGIPRFRIRTVSVTADSAATGYGALGRRLQVHPLDQNATYQVNSSQVSALRSARRRTTVLEINLVHGCDVLECGAGHCEIGDDGSASCRCDEGWTSPDACEQGDCLCSIQTCHSDCVSCVGAGPQDCVTCGKRKPFLRLDGSCQVSCAVGEYADESRTCHACNASCFSCSGPTSEDCVECSLVRGLPFWQEGKCVGECPAGSWANARRECVACDASCQTCSGPGSLACTSCLAHSCEQSWEFEVPLALIF